MDRGGEYRSLLGLPGGLSHPLYPQIENAAVEAGFKLRPGKGNDPDTLGQQIVYIMDSNEYPFHQAEVYHQVSHTISFQCMVFCCHLLILTFLHQTQTVSR